MIRSPDVMSSSPAIIRNAVDFPHPDGPTKIMNSPSPISRSIAFTASKPSGYRLVTWSNAICATASLPLLKPVTLPARSHGIRPLSSGAEGCRVQNVFEMSGGTRAAFARALTAAPDDDVYRVRLERHFAGLYEPLERLYGGHPAFEAQLESVLAQLAAAHAARDGTLRRLDHEREITPDWFQRQRHAGY